MDPHYKALIITYTTVVAIWFACYYFLKKSFSPSTEIFTPKKPYMEFAFAFLACLIILGIGQLYINGLLIPNPKNKSRIIDALNQVLIFSPTLVLVWIRKQPLISLWLPKKNLLWRFGVGFFLSSLSLFVYWVVRENSAPLNFIFKNIYHPKNVSHLVQVIMEDLTIALLFVRLSSWIGGKWTLILVAILFAAGHIPSMLSEGYSFMELGTLLLDSSLGVIVLLALYRSKDVAWFFLVHFVLDMTQFYGVIP